jgi:hypothetical protein
MLRTKATARSDAGQGAPAVQTILTFSVPQTTAFTEAMKKISRVLMDEYEFKAPVIEKRHSKWELWIFERYRRGFYEDNILDIIFQLIESPQIKVPFEFNVRIENKEKGEEDRFTVEALERNNQWYVKVRFFKKERSTWGIQTIEKTWTKSLPEKGEEVEESEEEFEESSEEED